jgi:AraC-like DNA-binding protein
MTGFADQAHLTRNFRKILGYTPGAWAHAVRGRALLSIPDSKRRPHVATSPAHK